jgi:hypothetical protein
MNYPRTSHFSVRHSFSSVLSITAMFCVLVPFLAFADEAVSPDTPSVFIPPPPLPPRAGKTPPECVNHLLELVYEGEKANFIANKSYSTSFIEMHLGSKMGVGCAGWDFPVLELTYGGTGFTATVTEAATEIKWTINQDKALFGREKKVAPLPQTPAPSKK